MGQISDMDIGGEVDPVGFCLRNSKVSRSLEAQLGHLPSQWQSQFKALIAEFLSLFQDVPGRTIY